MSNKLLEKITPLLEKINEKNFPVVIGGAILLIFLIDGLLILGPQLSGFNKLSEKIKSAQEEEKDAKDNIDKMAFYTNERTKLKNKFEVMNARIKSRDEVSNVLARISKLAIKNNIKVDKINPNIVRQQELLKEKERVYVALPVDIQGKADYHSFGRFLNEIEKDDLLLMVSDFQMSSSEVATGAKQNDFSLTLQAIIYDFPKDDKKK